MRCRYRVDLGSIRGSFLIFFMFVTIRCRYRVEAMSMRGLSNILFLIQEYTPQTGSIHPVKNTMQFRIQYSLHTGIGIYLFSQLWMQDHNILRFSVLIQERGHCHADTFTVCDDLRSTYTTALKLDQLRIHNHTTDPILWIRCDSIGLACIP